jgi:hypothetical protein
MPVSLAAPVTTPAAEAATYPYVWFTQIHVQSADPAKDAQVLVRALPYDGAGHVLEGSPLRLHVGALFAASQYDAEQIAALNQILSAATTAQKLALAQTAIYAALEAKGREMGVW